jgi:threonine/homoserine/homoserine lactone efflux protein
MLLLLKGMAIGLAISAPVGPIGLLCIRRSMLEGRLAGLFTGLGAATADALYGLIAVLGLSVVTTLLLAHTTAIHWAGGVFLIYLGIHMLRAKPPVLTAGTNRTPNLGVAYFSAVFLTLANPITILAFIGIFSGLGISLSTAGNPWNTGSLVLGVFLGSCSWWLCLSSGASWISGRLNPNNLHKISVGAGSLIIAFGCWEIGRLIGRLLI